LIASRTRTLDDFLDELEKALKQEGSDFPSGKHLGNFVAKLSNPSGFILAFYLQAAEHKGLIPKGSLEWSMEKTHQEAKKLFSDSRKEEQLSDWMVSKEKPQQELAMREALLGQKTADEPEYCAIGNPELRDKYMQDDLHAKNFVFRCLQKMLAEGKLFYEDLWQ
jgi:hypothetical protein